MTKVSTTKKNTPNLPVIGNSVLFDVAGIKQVPAKIDTGAAISAIWATNIRINSDDQLEFVLFAPESKYYTGEVIRTGDYSVCSIRSSNGHEQLRYVVKLSTRLEGRKILVSFTLADRKANKFPVLIGAKTLKGKFLVNVAEQRIPIRRCTKSVLDRRLVLNHRLKENPQKFHQDYMQKAMLDGKK